jgi:hypothetical protein
MKGSARAREARGSGFELGEGLGEAVGGLDVVAAEVAQELVSWLPGTQRRAGAHHRHHEAEDPATSGPRSTRSPRKTTRRPAGWLTTKRRCRSRDAVAELAEEVDELVEAAVDVADDVEGAGRRGGRSTGGRARA